MGRISRARHREQVAAFKQLDLSQPITTNQVRRLMQQALGYWPGERWTKNRMHERGVLLPRLEALELVRCPIHRIWMNSECAMCSGKVVRCGKCGALKTAGLECEVCITRERR